MLKQATAAIDTNIMKMRIFQEPFAGPPNMLWDNSMMKLFNQQAEEICNQLIGNDQLLAQLKAEQYDVAISEFFDHCVFGLFHAVDIPTKLGAYAITMNSMAGELFGIPSFSSWVTSESTLKFNQPKKHSYRHLHHFHQRTEHELPREGR